MKQIAHIAKTRGYVLAELLYIQSSASRQRPIVIFVNYFACHFIYLKTMNNEMFHITHLSADELSCLNCLPAKSLAFDFFCHQILRSHALKIKISKKRLGAETNVYKCLVLASRLVVNLSMRHCCKMSIYQLVFCHDLSERIAVILYIKIANETISFSSELSCEFECSKPLAHNVFALGVRAGFRSTKLSTQH